MLIRTFQSEDTDAVVALTLKAWAPVFPDIEKSLLPGVYKAFYPEGWEVLQEKTARDVCADPDVMTFLAIEDDQIVGFSACKLHDEDSMGEVYMIATDPDYQRRGIAKQLIDRSVEWMTERGMQIAMIETGGDPGHAPARATYENAGFTFLPVARFFKEL